MRSRLSVCLLPDVTVGIPAQTVHLVGPGGLPETSSALAIAAPGDVIHVQPGTCLPFTVGIACTIRALAPGAVTVQTAAASPPPVAVAVPSGQVVHPAGLDFRAAGGGAVAITGGRVTLDQCAAFSLTYKPIPNSYAAVFVSQELASLTIPGMHAQTQWLGGLGIVNLGVVLADASGQATATWNIPAGAWLVDQPLWFQGLTGFSFPLQQSPVTGGLIR